MTKRKNQNSILVLATLGVYLGLVLVGAAPQVLAQANRMHAADSDIYLDHNGVFINTAPAKAFGVELIQKLNSRQITWDMSFRVTIKGTIGIGKDGNTVILDRIQPVELPYANTGDQEMVKLAQHALMAFAASGWFGYVDKVASGNVFVLLEQTDQRVVIKLTLDQPDEAHAKRCSTIVNALLAMAARETLDADTRTFLQAAGAQTEDKKLVVNLELSKHVFTEMVQRKLAGEMAIRK